MSTYFDCWTDSENGDSGWLRRGAARVCPYCETALVPSPRLSEDAVRQHEANLATNRVMIIKFEAMICQKCGWWHVVHGSTSKDERDHSIRYSYQAVIKSIDSSSPDVAVSELGKFLSQKPDMIYDIHHKKMEELAGSILSEHFDCEVRYCGRSGDRGVDLLLVIGSELIPIQVKRRTAPGKTESVSVVREMLGVLFRDERRNAMIVTTADRFSKDARRDVKEVLTRGLVDRFELIDYPSFRSMLASSYKADEVTCDGVLRRYLDSDGDNRLGHLWIFSPDEMDQCVAYTQNGVDVNVEALNRIVASKRREK